MEVLTNFTTLELLPLAEPTRQPSAPHIPPRRPRIAFSTSALPPASSSSPSTGQQWIATSHYYPAAWPRSHVRSARSDDFHTSSPHTRPFAPLPKDPQQAKAEEKRRREADFAVWKQHNGTQQQSKETLGQLQAQADARSHHSRLAQAQRSNEEQLWACVQRIVPVDLAAPRDAESAGPQHGSERQQGYTLIVSHANGLHKEVWEPALGSIVQNLSSTGEQGAGSVRIDEIWSFDCTHSGEASSLNRDKLGDVVSWFDHPRDVMQFLDSFLPDLGTATRETQRWHPTFLKRTDGKAEARKRKFILMGHSFGGTTMATLASARPDTFQGLVLVDPAVPAPELRAVAGIFDPENTPLARGAIARKDAFTSAKEVRYYCTSKAYFKAWDPKVLDLHLRFGIRPMSVALDRAVTSDDLEEDERNRQPMTWSNPKWLEADAFAQTWMSLYTVAALEQRKTTAWSGHLTMRGTKGMAKGLPGIASQELDCNHLVVQEEPEKLGRAVAELILSNVDPVRREAQLLSTVERPRL